MRLNIACIIAFVLICIFVQSTAASQCSIIVNNGAAAGAYVEVLDGSGKSVFWGPTNSKGTCYPNLDQGSPYTVIVKWNGMDSRTNIIANDVVNVWV